jgi:mannosyltransferase OCH1-like enzyme
MQCPAVECRPLQILWASQVTRLPNGVPKIIHQTWKTDTVPDHWALSKTSWATLHPDWIYLLWTDQDIEAYITYSRGPTMWNFFQSLPHAIQRIDLWRYFVLADFGGLYSDLDIAPVQNVEPYLSSGNVFLVNSANTPSHFTNALMASNTSKEARVFWTTLIEYVLAFPQTYQDRVVSMLAPHLHIMMSTGPMALTRVSQTSVVPITVLPRRIWNPFDLSVAGSLEDQNDKLAIVRILHGSSWHDVDSKFISLLHIVKWPLISLAVLLLVYYVIWATMIRYKMLRWKRKVLTVQNHKQNV